MLLSTGDEALVGVRVGHVLVDVHPYAELVGLHGREQRAVARVAAGAEDDVSALAEHRGRLLLAPVRVVERLGATGRLVDAERLDCCVGVLGAVLIAHAVLVHWRDVEPVNATDGAALGHLAGHDAGQEPGLVLTENKTGEVRRRLVIGVVDDGELDGRVGLGHGQRVVTEQEADGDHHVVLLVDEQLHVLLVVGRLVGLDDLGLHAKARVVDRVLYALPSVGVEGLVRKLADVGDKTDVVRLGAARSCSGRAAASDSEQSGRQERRQGTHALD